MKFADLHLHTQFSDGTFTPEELVLYAQKTGLACIALTDHDTVEGCVRTATACAAVKMEFISGAELTAEHADTEVQTYHGVELLSNLRWIPDSVDGAMPLASLIDPWWERTRELLTGGGIEIATHSARRRKAPVRFAYSPTVTSRLDRAECRRFTGNWPVWMNSLTGFVLLAEAIWDGRSSHQRTAGPFGSRWGRHI